jgi:hypothetical protein
MVWCWIYSQKGGENRQEALRVGATWWHLTESETINCGSRISKSNIQGGFTFILTKVLRVLFKFPAQHIFHIVFLNFIFLTVLNYNNDIEHLIFLDTFSSFAYTKMKYVCMHLPCFLWWLLDGIINSFFQDVTILLHWNQSLISIKRAMEDFRKQMEKLHPSYMLSQPKCFIVYY